jgi:hypothetical protein
VLLAAGCGGDDQHAQSSAGPGQQTEPRTGTERSQDTVTTEPGKTPGQTTTSGSSGGKGPESQPGGAGDEEPARSPATFTGSGGRIRPALVQVPPFISVQVSLRSGDGGSYGLTIGGRSVRSGKPVTLDGLRPGAAYDGRGSDGRRIRIEASAEPGP